jgi:GNAT superfamily N-acetyltransferase
METSTPASIPPETLVVRPMRTSDLDVADRIFRVAFGTFVGLTDPLQFAGDTDFVRSRFAAAPDRAFAAERAGELLGSNFASRWGSVAFFGPLTTRPDCWDQGVGKRLLEPVMECFASWGVTLAGLYTFAESAKHVALYQKYGFWPRMLTAIMARPVSEDGVPGGLARFGALGAEEREGSVTECARLTDQIYAGLDLADEIRAVHRLGLGDTVLLRDDAGVEAFAVCHWGAGSEGGSGTCYVKFGAVRMGAGAEARFDRLLAACDAVAHAESLSTVLAGVNAGRERAWRAMARAGFRTAMQGVAMHRDNAEGYSRPDVFALDDWR